MGVEYAFLPNWSAKLLNIIDDYLARAHSTHPLATNAAFTLGRD